MKNMTHMKIKCLFMFFLVVIIIMVAWFLFGRTLHSSPETFVGNTDVRYDKLMIVAHPDDELIFGGAQLIGEPGWKVICVTNGSPRSKNWLTLDRTDRRFEFVTVMHELDCAYEMWDFEDNGLSANWDLPLLLHKLTTIIREKPYKKIVTHNLQGEYGHVQHKKISQLVHYIKPDNLYVFSYDTAKINSHLPRLKLLLRHYPSQSKAINDHYIYVKHQTVKKVNI